jgi:hypothetical protein
MRRLSGIKTILVLSKDKSFKITEEYLERNSKNEDTGMFNGILQEALLP